MKIIIGGVSQPYRDGSSVTIKRAMSDPVPTCSLNLRDNDSSIQINAMDEVLVLDEMMIPNPTINLLKNPSYNPYTDNWNYSSPVAGITASQQSGGGAKYTFSNAALNATQFSYQYVPVGSVVPGQLYTASFYALATSPVNIKVGGFLACVDQAQNVLDEFFFTDVNAPTSLTRYSVSFTAPAGTSFAYMQVGPFASNATNSGNVVISQAQLEPAWFPTQSYPSPWCGPAQTNCVQLPGNELWIRQYRKFGGFVNHTVTGDYHGDVRTIQVNAVGYAWLMGLVISNKTYSSRTDAFIIGDLLSTYFSNSGAGTTLFDTSQVLTGITLSSVQSNWDDLRTNHDNLAAQSGFFWTVDAYWGMIYEAPGWTTMPISLICDNSSTPNMTTTFPAYDFSAEMDYTQPGAMVLVIGNGSSVALVQDPNVVANMQNITMYGNGNNNIFMRKINESGLASNTDVVNRGLAEILQYDYPRYSYHLTADVELIAGQGIAVTSDTENLSSTILLIQQVSASWLGVDSTLTDLWQYTADLGTINRAASNILSHIFRTANQNTSAPAIAANALVVVERFGVLDTPNVGSVATGYAPTILANTPLCYYRLNNLSGTVVDDYSGNAYTGSTHASPTLGVTTLLTDAEDSADKAITFAGGSSQYVSLPTTFIPTGSLHAWSIESWAKIASIPGSTGNYTVFACGSFVTGKTASIKLNVATGGSIAHWVCSTVNQDVAASGNVATATTYHLVGTYDGTNLRLYINGSLAAGPTAYSVTLGSTYASIAAFGTGPSEFFTGTVDECAFYDFALNGTQIADHYAAGT